jgi:hypothetical protein
MPYRFNHTAMWVTVLAVFLSTSGCQEPVDFYAEGMDAIDKDDFTTAVRLFTKAITTASAAFITLPQSSMTWLTDSWTTRLSMPTRP